MNKHFFRCQARLKTRLWNFVYRSHQRIRVMIWQWKITVATDDFDIRLTLEQWDIEITKGSDSRFNCSSSCNQIAFRLKQATSTCFMDHHHQQRRNSSSNRYSQDISSHEQLFWGKQKCWPSACQYAVETWTSERPEVRKCNGETKEATVASEAVVNQYCLHQRVRTKKAGNADWKICYLFG